VRRLRRSIQTSIGSRPAARMSAAISSTSRWFSANQPVQAGGAPTRSSSSRQASSPPRPAVRIPITPPGRSARAIRATAPGLSGNQCSAMAEMTASKESSSTPIAMTSSARSSTRTSGNSPSLVVKTSSIPSAGSTPTRVETSKRRIIAAAENPVPQPTSSTRA
jgi:hypothetical protein